jgi:Uma2 family endonuclease
MSSPDRERAIEPELARPGIPAQLGFRPMAHLRIPDPTRARPALQYVRAPQPIAFPEEEEVPEGYLHLVVRTFLFQLLSFVLGPGHSVGSDQFVYWNAANAKRKLSPDVFVRLGVAQTAFGSWKTWEGGAPDLAIEIISPNEDDGIAWDEKLARYHEVGVRELVRFDPEEPEGRRLRVWDRVREDLVERMIADDRTPCLTLGGAWVVRMIPSTSGDLVGLRLVDDDGRLVETREESEAARAAAAEARVQELEAELRRRGGGAR